MYVTCHVNTYTYTLHITYTHTEISHAQKLINTHINTPLWVHIDTHTLTQAFYTSYGYTHTCTSNISIHIIHHSIVNIHRFPHTDTNVPRISYRHAGTHTCAYTTHVT